MPIDAIRSLLDQAVSLRDRFPSNPQLHHVVRCLRDASQRKTDEGRRRQVAHAQASMRLAIAFANHTR